MKIRSQFIYSQLILAALLTSLSLLGGSLAVLSVPSLMATFGMGLAVSFGISAIGYGFYKAFSFLTSFLGASQPAQQKKRADNAENNKEETDNAQKLTSKRIQTLKKEKQTLEANVERLEKSLASAQKKTKKGALERKRLAKELKETKAALKKVKAELLKVQKENSHLKDQLIQEKHAKVSLAKEIAHHKQEKLQLHKANTLLSNKLNKEQRAHQSDVDRLKSTIADSRQAIEGLECQLEQETQQHQSELKALDREIQNKRSEIHQLNQAMKSAQKHHRQKVENLVAQIHAHRNQKKTLENKLAQLNEAIQLQSEENEHLGEAIKSQSEEFRARVKQLQSELAGKEESLSLMELKLQQKMQQHSQQVNQFKKELTVKQAEIEKLSQRVEAKNALIDGLHTALKVKEKSLQALKRNLDNQQRIYEEEIQGLKHALGEKQGEVKALYKALVTEKAHSSSLKDNIAEKEKELAQVHRELEEMENAHNEAKSVLQNTITALKMQNAKMTEEKESLKAELSGKDEALSLLELRLQTQLKAHKKEVGELNTMLLALEMELKEAEKTHKNEISTLKEQFDLKEVENKGLKAKLSEKDEAISLLELKLQAQLDETQQLQQNFQAEKGRLEEKVETTEAKVNKLLKLDLERREEINFQKEKVKEAKQAHQSDLNTVNDTLNRTKLEACQEIKALKKAHSEDIQGLKETHANELGVLKVEMASKIVDLTKRSERLFAQKTELAQRNEQLMDDARRQNEVYQEQIEVILEQHQQLATEHKELQKAYDRLKMQLAGESHLKVISPSLPVTQTTSQMEPLAVSSTQTQNENAPEQTRKDLMDQKNQFFRGVKKTYGGMFKCIDGLSREFKSYQKKVESVLLQAEAQNQNAPSQVLKACKRTFSQYRDSVIKPALKKGKFDFVHFPQQAIMPQGANTAKKKRPANRPS